MTRLTRTSIYLSWMFCISAAFAVFLAGMPTIIGCAILFAGVALCRDVSYEKESFKKYVSSNRWLTVVMVAYTLMALPVVIYKMVAGVSPTDGALLNLFLSGYLLPVTLHEMHLLKELNV